MEAYNDDELYSPDGVGSGTTWEPPFGDHNNDPLFAIASNMLPQGSVNSGSGAAIAQPNDAAVTTLAMDNAGAVNVGDWPDRVGQFFSNIWGLVNPLDPAYNPDGSKRTAAPGGSSSGGLISLVVIGVVVFGIYTWGKK